VLEPDPKPTPAPPAVSASAQPGPNRDVIERAMVARKSDPALNASATPAEIAKDAEHPLKSQPEPQPEPKPADTPQAQPLPSFVRRADRAARWNQPRVRAGLAAGVVVGALLLAAQVGLAYRDLAAARWPALRPLLTALCQPLACTVSPPKSIDDLTVEGSALVRVDLSDLYQLNVALRNRAELDLAMPALELSLTDSQGRVLSRRVLKASDFGITQPTLAAGRDLAMQTTLRTAPQSTDGANGEASAERAAIVGYTIELFYP